jgi:hypothetical protein
MPAKDATIFDTMPAAPDCNMSNVPAALIADSLVMMRRTLVFASPFAPAATGSVG